MSSQTPKAAEAKWCPYTFGGNYGAVRCTTHQCMAWRVVHPEHRREDHSGAKEHLFEQGFKTGRTARREGGPSSSGFWVLDEVGECARLKSN